MGGGCLDDDIKELMEYIEASSFVEFELEREGFKIKLVKRSAPAANGPLPATGISPAVSDTPSLPPHVEAPLRPAPPESPDVHVVKSPIVGTFYRASGPGTKPFVEVGDRIKKGQVLCIVEAMKLMNEIDADSEGEIAEILVANGQPVEYGEPLFKIRKAAA